MSPPARSSARSNAATAASTSSASRHVDRVAPDDLDVHLILDNYGTHKTAKVEQWLLRHRRFHCHFTPTYSSWLNLVERFFASLTEHQLRRGSHRSVVALETAIRGYLDIHKRAGQAVPVDEIRRRDHRISEQRT